MWWWACHSTLFSYGVRSRFQTLVAEKMEVEEDGVCSPRAKGGVCVEEGLAKKVAIYESIRESSGTA